MSRGSGIARLSCRANGFASCRSAMRRRSTRPSAMS
jgi:hypothetical protein